MITLGIDVGTTHTKVLALEIEGGQTLALAAAPTPIRRDGDGEARRGPDVLDTVIELVSGVVDELDRPHSVVALSIASVGEEVVLLDPAGRALADIIAWYDPRGSDEAAAFMAGPGGDITLSRRWPPDATFSLFKLMWLRDNRPEEYAAATTWTDLGDYLLAGLGGEVVMDWSHASRAGGFDLLTCGWDGDSIAAAALDLSFPQLVPSGRVVGTLRPAVARRAGLPGDVSIVSGGHDHLCAAFGAGVRSSAELFLSAGTSEAHLSLLTAPVVDTGGHYHLDQGCYVDPGTYYAHVNIHSGHFFKQWRGLLYGDVDDETMYAEVAEADPGRGGITFTLHDDLRHGRLDGVPYGVGRAVLMRAILEGLADRSADIVAFLERASGQRFETILAAGRPAQVPLWREIRRHVYRRPMAIVDEPESAAFGAAVIAARACAGPEAGHLVAPRTVVS